MKRITFFLFLLIASGFIIPSDLLAGGGKETYQQRAERVRIQQERETLSQLKKIEVKLDQATEERIKELDEIIRYSIENDLTKSLAKAYLLMGKAYKIINQPKLAIYFMESAKSVYEKPVPELDLKKVSEKEAKNYNFSKIKTPQIPRSYYLDMAEINSMLRDYAKSNKFYVKYRSTEQNDSNKLNIDYAIASNYYAAEDYENAILLYNQILEFENRNNNPTGVADCYSRLAACYISLDKTEKGMEFYNKSIQGNGAGYLNDNSMSNSTLVSKALRKKGKFKEDISLRNQTLSEADAGIEHLRLAQSYYGANDFVECENSLDKFFEKPSYKFIDRVEVEVIKTMALRLKKENDSEKSFQYLLGYQTILDSIKSKISRLQKQSEKDGTKGFRNIVELENLQKDREIARVTIDHLVQKDLLKEEVLSTQKNIIYLLVFFILMSIATLIYILRVSRQRRIANQQLALRSLQSQMNPHFIFNALNSVNSFISVSDERSANQFLSEFSKLMRAVMENSENDFIPLYKELEIIKIYLELEHFRFKNKFKYQLNIDPKLEDDSCEIPPMLLQPYIENAIWHGLRYKESEGELVVSLISAKNGLEVVIQDNGIGRQASQKVKTKNQMKTKSTALRNINERIQIFNDLHKIKIEVSIEDLHENGSGTVVTLHIPQN